MYDSFLRQFNAPQGPTAVGKSFNPRLISVLLLLVFIFSASFAAARKDVTKGFDELAHISYVAELQATPGGVRLEKLRMLDPASFQFTEAASYLNHPSLYYRGLAVVGPPIEGRPASVLWHRLINVAIVTVALGLLFALSHSIARSSLETLILTVPMFCIPFLAALAGSVNNDNLGFLSGALVLFGSWRFVTTNRTSDLGIALLGVVVAGAAKLTAVMLCGPFLVLFLALARPKMTGVQMGSTAVALALGAFPYVMLWSAYGSPAPDTPAQHALLVEGAAAAGWAGLPRLGPVAYGMHFLFDFIAAWKPLLTQRTALQAAMLLLPSAALLLAAAGTAGAVIRWQRNGRARLPEALVIAGSAAIAVTLFVHGVFSYGRHLETGWLMDAYPRYYLPLAFIVPVAILYLVRCTSDPRAKASAAGFAIAGPVIFGLLG